MLLSLLHLYSRDSVPLLLLQCCCNAADAAAAPALLMAYGTGAAAVGIVFLWPLPNRNGKTIEMCTFRLPLIPVTRCCLYIDAADIP